MREECTRYSLLIIHYSLKLAMRGGDPLPLRVLPLSGGRVHAGCCASDKSDKSPHGGMFLFFIISCNSPIPVIPDKLHNNALCAN